MEGKIIKCVPNEAIERAPDDILGAEIYADVEENELENKNPEIQKQDGGIQIDAGDDEEIDNERPEILKATKGKKASNKNIKTKNVKTVKAPISKPTSTKGKKLPSFSGNEFQKESLNQHNIYRKKHKVPELILSKELCNIAQEYANKLASTDTFQHSKKNFKGKPMGENLFACYGMKITGKIMSDAWYDEIKDYNFNNPGFKGNTGHFTQVVWKDSKQVGFGFAKSKSGYYYGVANYFPAGNYINEFDKNVFKE
jgi:uncharacterized protein YkwD